MRTRHARKIRKGILLAREVIDTYVETHIRTEGLIGHYSYMSFVNSNVHLRCIGSSIAFRQALNSGELTTKAYSHTTRRSWSEDVRLRREVITKRMEKK